MDGHVAKLEQRVGMAAAKLVSQMDQTRQELENTLKELLEKAAKAEAEAEGKMKVESGLAKAALEAANEASRSEAEREASLARDFVQRSLESSKTAIDEHRKELYAPLADRCETIKRALEAESERIKSDYEAVVDQGSAEVVELSEKTAEKLKTLACEKAVELSALFQEVKSRLQADAESSKLSLERQGENLLKDLEQVAARGDEKIKTSRAELLEAMERAEQKYIFALKSAMKAKTNSELLPVFREHRSAFKAASSELREGLMSAARERQRSRGARLDQECAKMRDDFAANAGTAILALNSSWESEQARLASVFEAETTSIHEKTQAVVAVFQESEKEISSNEAAACKRVEAAGVAIDASLNAARDETAQAMHNFKQPLFEEARSSLDKRSDEFDEKISALQNAAVTAREGKVRQVSEMAEDALAKIRGALGEAFGKIQASRQRYLPD